MHAHFSKLRQNLEPNPTFAGVIETRHAAVRSALATNSHLIGSLQRKTRIQPNDGETFDIDVLVVLDEFRGWVASGGITSPAAIQHVLAKAQASDRYAVKNPIADAPTVSLQFADNVKVELVPAYLDQVGVSPLGVPHSPAGRAYWVPDGVGGWMLADYDFDAQYITQCNTNSDGLLVPVIKMLKSIKRLHFPLLKSFALEILAAQSIPAFVHHCKAKGIPITYPLLLEAFFILAKSELQKPISIPGSLSSPIVLSAWESSTIAAQFDAVLSAIQRTTPLAETNQIPNWRVILGFAFPSAV
jgi:hypothetical protein